MKRLLVSALLALSTLAFGATLTPIQLLNPAGSTSGQAILSTGASTPPAWGNVSLSGLTGVLPIANGGTGASAASTARVNLGLGTAATVNTGTSGSTIPLLNGANTWSAAQTFASNISVSNSSPIVTFNATSGSTLGTFNFNAAGVTSWQEQATTSSLAFARYNAGVFVDSPFILSNSTGAVTMMDGITNSPISGSTGSFTSVTASGGTLNGMTIGTSSPGSAQFSQLVMTGLLTPQSTTGIKGTTTNDSPAAGSVGENPTNSASGVSMTNNTPANCASVSLTAGNYLVYGQIGFIPNISPATTINQVVASISTTSATLGSALSSIVTTFTAGTQQQIPAALLPLKLASTTTVFLVGQAQFATSTMTCNGSIGAIRIR